MIGKTIIKKSVSCIMAALTVVVTLTGCAQTEATYVNCMGEYNKLVVYTSHGEKIYGPIIREFEERTGIWVEVVVGGTNMLLEDIKDESGKPRADIMFGGGVDNLGVYEEYFARYRSTEADALMDMYASRTDRYTVFSRLPVVICYNTRLVHSSELPEKWSDILDPSWKGKIAFANPAKSGSSYTALCMIGQMTAEETGSFDKSINLLIENTDGDILASSSDVTQSIISGDKLIGIVTEEAALKEIAKQADIGIVYPEDGIMALPDGCAIVEGAPHLENAKKFLDFAVSEDAQRLLEEEMYRRSVRTEYEDTELKELIYDVNEAQKKRAEIIERFMNEDDTP